MTGPTVEARGSRLQRVVVKLSGQALSGSVGWGNDADSVAALAGEILAAHAAGVQTAVVVGGGNYFRGRTAPQWGIDRAEADNIGMLATVMNALMLRGELNARSDCDVRVMTATSMPAFAEPFIRLRARHHLELGRIVLLAGGVGQPYVTTDYAAVQRALELDADALLLAKHGVDAVYDHDPRSHPDATRYDHLSHRQALALGVQVMDTGALVLAAEHHLPMHVFDAAVPNAVRALCEGTHIGTSITSRTSA